MYDELFAMKNSLYNLFPYDDKLFLPNVEKMYITKIHEEFDGDTFFPEVNLKEWNEVSYTEGITDDENPFRYNFYVYERNN